MEIVVVLNIEIQNYFQQPSTPLRVTIVELQN